MSTMTARAPQPILTPGQRFTLRVAGVIAALFWAAFSSGLAERNMISDVITAVVFAYQVLTSPWPYCAAAAVVIVWRNRAVFAGPPPRRRRPVVQAQDEYLARHRMVRRG